MSVDINGTIRHLDGTPSPSDTIICIWENEQTAMIIPMRSIPSIEDAGVISCMSLQFRLIRKIREDEEFAEHLRAESDYETKWKEYVEVTIPARLRKNKDLLREVNRIITGLYSEDNKCPKCNRRLVIEHITCDCKYTSTCGCYEWLKPLPDPDVEWKAMCFVQNHRSSI